MNNTGAIAVLLAMAAIAISQEAPAVPLSPQSTTVRSVDGSLVTQVQSKNGAVVHSTGQLRTFRPFQVVRVRPTFARNKVRPGRPLTHRRKAHPHHLNRSRQGQLAQRKRPRRSRHIHVAGSVPPLLPLAIHEDSTQDFIPLSPDFCRYWEDRGVFVGDLEPCW